MQHGVRLPLVRAVGRVKKLQAKSLTASRNYPEIEKQLQKAIEDLFTEISKCCSNLDIGLNVVEYVRVVLPPYKAIAIHMPAEVININCIPVTILKDQSALLTLKRTETKVPWTQLPNPPSYVINPSSRNAVFYVRRLTIPI